MAWHRRIKALKRGQVTEGTEVVHGRILRTRTGIAGWKAPSVRKPHVHRLPHRPAIRLPMRPDTKTRLRFGPYRPPKRKRGGYLFCAIRGKVKPYAWSHGLIPWPLVRSGGFIFCGDLETAIRRESVAAVAHWWGVRQETVSCWRRLLEVPRMTAGIVVHLLLAQELA